MRRRWAPVSSLLGRSRLTRWYESTHHDPRVQINRAVIVGNLGPRDGAGGKYFASLSPRASGRSRVMRSKGRKHHILRREVTIIGLPLAGDRMLFVDIIRARDFDLRFNRQGYACTAI